MIISVAVPLFQHSPMFGHIDSSHTVARRCSRTFCHPREPLAAGIFARSQGGLRPSGAGSARRFCLTPFLIAATPCSVRNLAPLGTGAGWTIGMPLKLVSMREFSHGAGLRKTHIANANDSHYI
jgi:hypothetical protein